MCGRGNLCMYCSRKAVVAMHWESWAGNFCDVCSADLKREKEPKLIVMLENEGEDSCHQVS